MVRKRDFLWRRRVDLLATKATMVVENGGQLTNEGRRQGSLRCFLEVVWNLLKEEGLASLQAQRVFGFIEAS